VIKRYDQYINNHGNWIIKQSLESFESLTGPWCKEEDVAKLEKAIDQLKRYFTSGNDVPVERATILSKDFWSILNGI
jgi:hypothetical protein